MKIELHTKAIEKLNSEAIILLSLMKKLEGPNNISSSGLNDDHYNSATLTDKDIIGDIIQTSTYGNIIFSKAFLTKDGPIGFGLEEMKKLELIAKEFLKNRSISNVTTLNNLKNIIFEWCKDKYKKVLIDDFVPFVVKNIEDSVKNYRLIFPIPFTESNYFFEIGHIKFAKLTEKNIDTMINCQQPKDDETKEQLERFKEKIQKRFQGYLVGYYECIAEKSKAEELGYFHLSNSLNFLRIFSQSVSNFKMINSAFENGIDLIPKNAFFLENRDDNSISFTDAICDGFEHYVIDEKNLQFQSLNTFRKYRSILKIENLNEFQKKVIDTVNIYSKNALRIDLSDKLIYIFSAIEGVLLKNETEPIQQNLSERIAFLIGKTVEERKQIIKNIKDVYKIRSKIVHHGIQTITDYELLDEFSKTAFLTIITIIDFVDKYENHIDFINYIDDIKLK